MKSLAEGGGLLPHFHFEGTGPHPEGQPK